jgi:glyoxylate reductase
VIAKECSIILNNKEKPPTRRELLTGVRNRDAILCTLSDKIDRRVMDVAGSTLRVISSYSTVVDRIDTGEATKNFYWVRMFMA